MPVWKLRCGALAGIAVALFCAAPTFGQVAASAGGHLARSIAGGASEPLDWAHVLRVFTLRDHNTRVVLLGAAMLGIASGLVGTFLLLRKQSLLSDAISHATLPGIALAFLVMNAAGGQGKWLPGLLLGAGLAGALGAACVVLIRRSSRIKQDAALGVVLSVFFGLGVALLGIAQRTQTGSAAGLESFIYGKTASMLAGEAIALTLIAGGVALVCALLFKELSLLCFDQTFASAQGWPVLWLDVVLMALVVIVTVIGLQAVGLVLVISLLVVPAAAARFWTHQLPTMLLIAAGIGALSGLFGAGISALLPRLPAGAIIVLVAAAFFLASMIFGPVRGLLAAVLSQRRLRLQMGRQHLLRAMFECTEPPTRRSGDVSGGSGEPTVSLSDLLKRRSWSPTRLRQQLSRAGREQLIEQRPGGWRLTPAGRSAAERVVRNHRLWELYLITHADIAASHVDRGADQIEHVLEPLMIAELESLLADELRVRPVPPSPHVLPASVSNARAPAC